jgi:uncharacterized damage-inducible protein DinB
VRTRELLIEAYGRLPAIIDRAVGGLTPEQLRWAPAAGANTIGWLVWHLTRIQDHHVSQLGDWPQVWQTGNWAASFGVAPDPQDTGYGHTPAQVAAMAPESARVLVEYYAAVAERTRALLDSVTDQSLDEIVDENWDPPVTLGVRLVSVLDDDLQHAGQAGYLRGLLPG